MLTEQQWEALSQTLYERIQAVNQTYLEAIGKRFAELGELSPTDAHRLQRMLEWSVTDAAKVTNELAKATSQNAADVDAILRKVAQDSNDFAEPYFKASSVEYLAYSKNAELVALVKGLVQETQGTLENLTRTTAVQDIYKQALDQAVLRGTFGQETWAQSIRSTIKEVAQFGIYRVDYESGYRRRLDTAVRFNILDAMKRTNERSAELLGKQFGADGWEITFHSGSRPSHRPMQGRRYSVKDYEASGVGSLLAEANCRHRKFAIIMGVGSPVYSKEELARLKREDASTFNWNGKEIDRYAASQVMRKIETEVRKAKDVAVIAASSGDMVLRREMQARINLLNTDYTRITQASGLPTKAERMQVAGFRQVKA